MKLNFINYINYLYNKFSSLFKNPSFVFCPAPMAQNLIEIVPGSGAGTIINPSFPKIKIIDITDINDINHIQPPIPTTIPIIPFEDIFSIVGSVAEAVSHSEEVNSVLNNLASNSNSPERANFFAEHKYLITVMSFIIVM